MKTKSSFVALVGNSNVGKSTLLNCLVGYKASIVTHKVQTTRGRIRAILTQDKTQVVFVDTPGIFKPNATLERQIVKNAWSAFCGTDLFCIVVDPRYRINSSLKDIIKKCGQNTVLIINKIDLVERQKLLETAEILNNLGSFKKTFMISALKNSGIDDLKDFILSQAQEGPWYFEKDVKTDMPTEFQLAEISREKLFLRLHQELPYSLTVETESIKETFNKATINQIIYVERQSHKSIVLGAKGATIKTIRMQSTRSMESLLGKRVDLFLFVKVRENWQSNEEIVNSTIIN